MGYSWTGKWAFPRVPPSLTLRAGPPQTHAFVRGPSPSDLRLSCLGMSPAVRVFGASLAGFAHLLRRASLTFFAGLRSLALRGLRSLASHDCPYLRIWTLRAPHLRLPPEGGSPNIALVASDVWRRLSLFRSVEKFCLVRRNHMVASP